MFEYGPDGKRRLSQFGQRVITAMVVAGMVLAVTAWTATHVRSGDGAVVGGIVAGGFALAGTLFMQILNYGQGRKNEDILHYQNEKMEKIEGKFSEVETRIVGIINEAHRVERHDWMNELNKTSLAKQEAQVKLEEAQKTIALLMASQNTATHNAAFAEGQKQEVDAEAGRLLERKARGEPC